MSRNLWKNLRLIQHWKKIDVLRKRELLNVAKHYGVDVNTSMRKLQIKRLLVQDLVDEDILAEDALKGIPEYIHLAGELEQRRL